MAGIEAGKTWSRIGPQVAPTDSAASGVWQIQEASEYIGAGTWPAPTYSSYEFIVGHTFSGSTDSYTFTSIPQTYKSIRIIAVIKGASPQALPTIQINGVTTADYHENTVYSNSSSFGSTAYDGINYWSTALAATVNVDFVNEINLDGYENANICSPVQFQWACGSNPANSVQGNLQNGATAAITSLKYYSSSGANFASGSTISMFAMVDS